MTPDELICTTCEATDSVIWQCAEDDEPNGEWQMNFAIETRRLWRAMGGDSPWGVDFCPECGRGGEVGRL